MDDWKKFSERSSLEKDHFYSHLNMEFITNADYTHTTRICKDFKIKTLAEYHDLYVQIDTLLLANVFNNFSECVS